MTPSSRSVLDCRGHCSISTLLKCWIARSPQLDKARLSESLVGYGFLTTAQYIADLFSAVSDLPSVINASFPATLSYADPDYWLGALLLAFESHQKGPLERTAGLPIVIGFPESDNKITDLQINVPPAAMVAFLAGRAYRCPKCPTAQYVMDAHSGLPQVTGQASQEALQAWVAAAKHTDVETARLAQPSLSTFLGITLQGAIKNLGRTSPLPTLTPSGLPRSSASLPKLTKVLPARWMTCRMRRTNPRHR